jgi:hypothetical protein
MKVRDASPEERRDRNPEYGNRKIFVSREDRERQRKARNETTGLSTLSDLFAFRFATLRDLRPI